MSKGDLVDLLAEILTGLDHALTTSELLGDPPTWQLVYALRKHLDDQQRQLLQTVLQEEDETYRALTGMIQGAANGLESVIQDM